MIFHVILAGLLQISAAGSTAADCGTNKQAQMLAMLIMNHGAQERTGLECNELLAGIAAERARDLLNESTPKGMTPNQVLTQGGFKFASFYPPAGNQVEAVARDLATPEDVLEYLAGSYKHQDLVLGTGEFFSRQTQMGVGYQSNEAGETQWVVLIAEPYTSPRIVIQPEFDEPETVTVEECGKTWRHSKNDELRKVCRERWLERKSGEQGR